MTNPTIVIPSQRENEQCDIKVAKAVTKKNLGAFRVLQNNTGDLSNTICDVKNMLAILWDNDSKTQDFLNVIAENNHIGQDGVVLVLVSPRVSTGALIGRININQKIYFVNTESLVMSEGYRIGDQVIENDIGHYKIHHGKLMFNHTAKPFFERRTNFYGQHLKGMTDSWVALLLLEPGFEDKATFFEANQTYDVTTYASGLYFDIFNILSKKLNFTFNLYKRQDGYWGTVQGNVSSGMLKNLLDGDADVIVQGFGFNEVRMHYIQYTPFITRDHYSIFIRRQHREGIDWKMFIDLFHWSLWSMMAIFGLLMGVWLYVGTTGDTLRAVTFSKADYQ